MRLCVSKETKPGPWFEPDDVWDVAEIQEHPGYLMARQSCESPWPTPGDPLFDVPPTIFVKPNAPLEIQSCGHRYVDYLAFCFGWATNDQAEVDRVRKAEALRNTISDVPEPGEDYDTWLNRCVPSGDGPLPLYLFDGERDGRLCVDFGVFENVVAPPHCAPAFGYVGVHPHELIRTDTSRSVAAVEIHRLMQAIGLAAVEPDFIDACFWQRSSFGTVDQMPNA